MAPPVSAPSNANPSDCPDPSPVDLTPLKDLFDPSTPAAHLADPELQLELSIAATFLRIDDKKEGFGDGNGLLEKGELDQFLAYNKEILGPQATACTLLQEARLLASAAPSLKMKLGQTPAPTPVEPGDPQQIPSDRSRAELVFRFLEQTSQQKFEQEKIDHAGPAGDSYMGRLVGRLLFRESWNGHFQETRPRQHKEERDRAIETLKKTMSQHPEREGIKEALSYCDDKTVRVLKEDLNIDRWVQVADAKTDLDRSKILAQLADKYRMGKQPGFWDFNLIPCPRLGSGGWWNRALYHFPHFDNWSWGKSPDLLLALTIDNYLATQISHIYNTEKNGRSAILFSQLSPPDRDSLLDTTEKAEKGEEADLKAARDLVNRAPLTPEGKQILLDRLNWSSQVGNNIKLLTEFLSLPFMQSLTKQNREDVAMVFDAYIQGKLDGQQVTNIFRSYFPSEEAENLIAYLHRLTVVQPFAEDKGLETLFHETQLGGGQERRLREIFDKENPTEVEKKEFQVLLAESKLSLENQSAMQFLLDHQEENRIARAAEKEFWDILGSPTKRKNPITGEGEWDPNSVGNLHRSMLTTVTRTVGLGIFTAPTWGMAGVGGALSFGVGRLFNVKGLNPWWGAAAGAALGALLNLSPAGAHFRERGAEVLKTPFPSWSDLAVADMPSEGLGLYLDLAGGTKVMGGVMGASRHIYLLEKLGIILHTPPALLRGIGAGWAGLIAAHSLDGVWRLDTPLVPKFSESLGGSPPSAPFSGGL